MIETSSIPRELLAHSSKQGHIERLEYISTHTSSGPDVHVKKHANVYLPYYYDQSKQFVAFPKNQ